MTPQAHVGLLAEDGTPLDAIASYGTEIQVRSSADGVSPKTFTTIFGVGDIDGPSRAIDEIETTSHSTGIPIKTFVPSLIDPGDLKFPCFWNPNDPTIAADSPFGMEQLFYGRKITDFRLVQMDPARTTRQFRGFVKEIAEAAPVSGVYTNDVTIRISGAMSVVAAAVTLTPANATPALAGGAATVAVASTDAMPWIPASDSPWITIQSPTEPTDGNGTINYTVAANDSGAERVGHIHVGDKSFVVTQANV